MWNKNKWEITANRFVVFLDIMGFKDFVQRNPHDVVFEKMKRIADLRQKLETYSSKQTSYEDADYELEVINYSDSIMIFSKNDSQNAFESIKIAAMWFMAFAIKDGIPLKGAVAHGTISIEKDKHIYFGQPLIDAYLLQEEVHYYGVVFHHSVDKYILETDDEDPLNYFEAKTPMKTGMINHKNINWFRAKSIYEKMAGEGIVKSLESLYTITSGNPRRYIDNTISLYSESLNGINKI